jgi:uncharacterized protein
MNYAIVGATSNTEKYGYKITKNLLEKEVKIFPINPKGGKILGEKVFTNLSEIKKRIDWVIFVTPPEITKKVLEEVKELGLKKVWFQPGSESEKAIDFCKENNIDYTYNTCIMVETDY